MCKKILMVHNFYQIAGGEDTVFKNEVEMLRENGHEVIEYTCSNDELKKSKIKLLLLPLTTIWSWKTYREVKKIIKAQNVDIVHCHNTFPIISPSVYYAARNRNIPVVQTIHNFRFLCPCGVFYRNGNICEECRIKGNFKPAVKYKCYRNSKLQSFVVSMMLSLHRKLGTYKKINYIFLTEFNKQKFNRLVDINGKNIFVKPNFVKKIGEVKLPSKIFTSFVFAGRLEESKGIKNLLAQWKEMPDNYQLHIYGEGPLEQYVKEEIQDRDNIQYLGFQSHDVIYEDLKKSMAMIFPSLLYEGYPMIISESMAMGCPVVAIKTGNAGDIVTRSKGGTIYDPDDEYSFSNAIKTVIENNYKLRKKALCYYKDTLSKDKNYIEQNNIYIKISK